VPILKRQYRLTATMSPLIRDAFLEPALSLIDTLDNYRHGLDFSDIEFVTLGTRRIAS
jgi:hypothetical protein